MTRLPSSSQQRPSGRRVRSDKGHPQLTRRDEAILRPIGEQLAYRFDQLQGLLARHPDTQAQEPTFLSESRTAALIQRWKTLGLADSRKIRHYEQGWIFLTRKGLSHMRLPLHFLDPYHADLDHLFWINETRTLVEEAYGSQPEFRWESERLYWATRERLKARQRREPELIMPLEYQSYHRPDALIRYRRGSGADGVELVVSIEVERSEKANATWHAIFLDLLQHTHYTLYYVNPKIMPTFCKALTGFQAKEPVFGEPDSERRQCIYVHELKQVL